MKYELLYNKFRELADISAKEWEHLESKFSHKKFKKNEYLLEAGSEPRFMNIILSGLTRSFYIDHNGKEFNKIFFSQGDIASAYVEMLSKQPSRLSIQALEETDVLQVDYQHVQQLYDRDPAWNIIGRKIAENFFVIKEKREYEFLLLDAENRYKNFLEDYKDLKSRIPQYHVASYLGITSVSLSRLINAAKKLNSKD